MDRLDWLQSQLHLYLAVEKRYPLDADEYGRWLQKKHADQELLVPQEFFTSSGTTLIDAWGVPVALRSDGTRILLTSFGTNGKDDDGHNDDLRRVWTPGTR